MVDLPRHQEAANGEGMVMAKQTAKQTTDWTADHYPLVGKDAEGEGDTGKGRIIGVVVTPKGVAVFRQGGGKVAPLPGMLPMRQGLAFAALKERIEADGRKDVRVYRHKTFRDAPHVLALEWPTKWAPTATSAGNGPVSLDLL